MAKRRGVWRDDRRGGRLVFGDPVTNGETNVAKNVKRIAKKLGGKSMEQLPDVGGGAVGAMRMAKLLQARLQPGQGKRPGRPGVANWTRRPKVPMSEATEQAWPN